MSKTVMVVDDSLMIRQQVGRALRDAGYLVVEAVDGQDAIEKMSATPGGVSLVICDVNMPRMSGLEFLESVQGTTTPVVMLTTEGQAELVQKAKSLGAKGWITKPFKADLLVAATRKLAPQS